MAKYPAKFTSIPPLVNDGLQGTFSLSIGRILELKYGNVDYINKKY